MLKVLGNSSGITQGLIDVLHELFPNEIPTNLEDVNDLRRLQGQQDVIRKIEALYKDQIGDDS